MPIYEVQGTKTITWTGTVEADTAEEALEKADDRAVVPHISDEWDSDDDLQISDGYPVRIGEDGEDGEEQDY